MKGWQILMLGCAVAAATSSIRGAASPGESVVVLYNSKLPASKSLAEYYAEKRAIPAEHLIGLPLSEAEAISRKEYQETLEQPFLKRLEELKLLTFRMEPRTNAAGVSTEMKVPERSKLRYATLCFGVPVKIEQDNSIQEPDQNIPQPARRNEAAVDSELTLLPSIYMPRRFNGPLNNPYYGATNLAGLSVHSGALMVARLDGPSPEIARGLVDKALQAERDGLWGRAYFDMRGLTSGEYKVGDDMFKAAEKSAIRFGFETSSDNREPVYPPGFPLPQIGIYAGWYELNVAGAFRQPKMEFMPGAFAYHLHSYSAWTIRMPNERWVGPLLAQGATCTMGTTEEPFLAGTPDIAVFLGRWFFEAATFGEAAFASQRVLSWQTTVVGDPLYRPFSKSPQQQHEQLKKENSKLFDWSLLRIVNINLATGIDSTEAVKFLSELPETKKSALLNEKLGDMQKANGKWLEAVESYEAALALNPTPDQRLRIALLVTGMQMNIGQEKKAYEIYRGILKDYPNLPDRVKLYQKILPLADKHGKPGDTAEIEKALKDLGPASAK
jgi:uncharacterized protein (TIGR03790 family)